MKCEVCGKTITTTFLGKVKGTYVKSANGKPHSVCFECQARFKSKDELLQQLK